MADSSEELLGVLCTLGIVPNNISLYQTACIHRSYLNESPKGITAHNERLEFLGDAALELAMTHIIYETYPHKEEGVMTDLRSSYVRGTHLAQLALSFHLDTVILMSFGERNAGGTKNPNVLADFFEAIIGALYLDQGFSEVLRVVREVIFASEFVKSEMKDAKSLLQEIIQQHIKQTPEYAVINEIGKDHEKIFTIQVSISDCVIGTGEGTSKKLSQESAAKNALQNQEKWKHLLQK